ncbi:MAG TPA: hypothetical protein DIW46_00080 [Microbacterium sp.]|nr:hypothetical protein [Microbacterium sp.]
MTSVWIVFEETDFGESVIGVFGASEDAESYAKKIDEMATRTLIKNFPVPWRNIDSIGMIAAN